MARRIHVQLIDDLSGEDAQETIRFSIDGVDFEIDLSADNAADLRDTLKGYAAKGRRLRGPSGTSGGRTPARVREETQKVRNWAAENGYNPSPRGRISESIMQAYAAAQG
ncbi:histone-like nucleoid-structuring protein Lsr2 [Pseudarthrobacter sp. S9]|uniref:histone-like nucleoid-structuring protein Lsr2 n=1 Tax=Pseudarthrobacter sp. S9 TaxID=3418421 RepID=UPI003CFE6B5F